MAVRFLPDDVIEQPEAVFQQGHSHARVEMQGAGYPDGAGRLEHPLARSNPIVVELVVDFEALAPVPLALVYTHHPPCHTGDAVVGQLVGWISPDAVDRLRRDCGENFQRIAKVELGISGRGRPERCRYAEPA